MSLPINQVYTQPQLKDLLDLFEKAMKLELNCHHIGRIEKFYPDSQQADVSISYMQAFTETDNNGVPSIKSVEYPLLVKCPVIVLGGGLGYLTFPIGRHDECLILFNDRDLGNWFEGTYTSLPNTARSHSFPDGIVLVGVRNLDCSIPDYFMGGIELRYKGASIKVYQHKVVVSFGDGTVSMTLNDDGTFAVTNENGEIISQLIKLLQDIQTGTVNTIFGPQLLVMPTFATDLAVLETFQT